MKKFQEKVANCFKPFLISILFIPFLGYLNGFPQEKSKKEERANEKLKQLEVICKKIDSVQRIKNLSEKDFQNYDKYFNEKDLLYKSLTPDYTKQADSVCEKKR